MVSRAGIELLDIEFRIGSFRMDGLSLRVAAGEYFVLTGPNGAGKSLTIRLIGGLCRPLRGKVIVNGQDVTALPPWERQIGYVPQEGLLFPNRTVRGNIAFGLEVRGARRKAVAEAVKRVSAMLDIGHLLSRTPEGLSGGERQRIALARALAFEPNVLLLDEPVSAIDEAHRDDLCRLLRTIQRRLALTVLHVSHNSQETMLVADRVGTLVSGAMQTSQPLQRQRQETSQ